MYTILICYIIAFLLPIVIDYYECGSIYWSLILPSFFAGFIGAFIGLIIAISLPASYITVQWSKRLEALQDNGTIHGSFFLGTGQIDGAMKYVYYQQNEDSTYRMWQADYYTSSIRYTDEYPTIQITDTREKDNLWNKFAIDLSGSSQTYIFNVPKGTIKNNFQLDAQ